MPVPAISLAPGVGLDQLGAASASSTCSAAIASPVTAASAAGTWCARLRSSASRPASVPTGYQQRYTWPGVSASTSGGCSVWQRGWA